MIAKGSEFVRGRKQRNKKPLTANLRKISSDDRRETHGTTFDALRFCRRALTLAEDSQEIVAHQHLSIFKEFDERLDRSCGVGDQRYRLQRSSGRE
jgi:hypothetical protein